jgi:hypothetical protein
MTPREAAKVAEITRKMRTLASQLDRIARETRRAAFLILDVAVDLTPIEDRPPTSWEVEREQFLRGLG